MSPGSEPSDLSSDEDPWLVRYARILGFLGAAFVPLLLIVAWVTPEAAPLAMRLCLIYGGVILAFLGGVQWGFALTSRNPRTRLRRLGVSIVPSLWALIALSLPRSLCTLILITGLAALLAYEWLERADAVYPHWYLPLRLQLTTLLTASLALTLTV